VCVDDVCNVHCQMLQHDVSGIYNVGTGTATSFQSVADSVAKKIQCQNTNNTNASTTQRTISVLHLCRFN
jgi:nucleoside-diphosphate-sugar epimerase